MSELTIEESSSSIRKRMLDLERVYVMSMPPDSPYIRPLRMNYTQDGRQKYWDLMRVHDGVCIVIFNISRMKLVCVKQFRPPCYFASVPEQFGVVDVKKYPAKLGVSLELCAGIIDKNKSIVEIAREEVLEECGYDAPVSLFEKVNCYRSGVGSASSSQTLFYVEVTDDMRIHPGGGADSEGELIEVIEMNIQQVKDYLHSGNVESPSSFLYGVTWFLASKQDRYH
ncbi:uridine diphosphate glucose pyrophosphatase NUDT14-like isoform X1 [Leptopilina boulardi]|uniref:uridine diphosphate glucose pyrophosphatase NUDT14-like isoform X1 n=1 Tax=Leptopilina boulardi TaxID=63433 RepID=UPI0021F57892|nr:uridine diphosphate glucose pyrophosphatase NUDT14-like isoform X1 [Leptopilina boulardi]